MGLRDAVFSLAIVVVIGLQVQAASTVQRGNDTFFISNNGALMESSTDGKTITVTDDADLDSIYLFKNQYIVGYTKAKELYMLAPNERGQECIMKSRGVSFFKTYYRTCNWIQIGENVSQVFVDDKNILVVYDGSWGVFSTPTLMVFNSPKSGIYLPTPGPEEVNCGLGCVRSFGGAVFANQPFYTYPFENLEIINFKKLSYNDQNEIIVIFEKDITYPLTTVLQYKNYFKSSHWYDKLLAKR